MGPADAPATPSRMIPRGTATVPSLVAGVLPSTGSGSRRILCIAGACTTLLLLRLRLRLEPDERRLLCVHRYHCLGLCCCAPVVEVEGVGESLVPIEDRPFSSRCIKLVQVEVFSNNVQCLFLVCVCVRACVCVCRSPNSGRLECEFTSSL